MGKSNHLAGLISSYISGSLEDTSRSDSNDNFMESTSLVNAHDDNNKHTMYIIVLITLQAV